MEGYFRAVKIILSYSSGGGKTPRNVRRTVLRRNSRERMRTYAATSSCPFSTERERVRENLSAFAFPCFWHFEASWPLPAISPATSPWEARIVPPSQKSSLTILLTTKVTTESIPTKTSSPQVCILQCMVHDARVSNSKESPYSHAQ